MNDLTEFQNSDGHWISEAAHKQALAEKDREIAKWNELVGAFTQSKHKYLKNHEQLKKAYQQLMAQAVRFAEWIQCDLLERHEGDRELTEHLYPIFSRTVQFFRSPEAQAFLKEREGT